MGKWESGGLGKGAKMRYRELGKTGLTVSAIGLGCAQLGSSNADYAVRVVRQALDLGVTYIDLARGYRDAEIKVGLALRAGAPARERLVISTKTSRRTREEAWREIHESLERIGTGYLDNVHLHGLRSSQDIDQRLGPGGAMEAALEAQQAGKVRHIGVSSHSLEVALQMVPTGHFETIQFPFNYITREPADELLPLAQAHDLGFIAMKPFAGGLLDKANLSIKWLLQFPGVVPDPGIETVEEMAEIVRILEGGSELTPRERGEIQDVRHELGTRFCRRCEYCQPCPQEIAISTVMNIRSFYQRFPPERFFSGRFPQTVERAKTCLECGECEERCPYQLPIREMLVENVAFFESVRP